MVRYFGGNGVPANGDCIPDGAFSDLQLVANATIYEQDPLADGATCCIKRYLPEEAVAGGLLTLANIKDLLVGAEDFSSFNLMIENGPGLLGYMQMFVGGEDAKTSKDPLFLSMYVPVSQCPPSLSASTRPITRCHEYHSKERLTLERLTLSFLCFCDE